ncbi:ATP--guanido phosphotransferase [uncultured Clostridium sp.]|uniref:ATP--guanido phosphotransferase n=1 Tax=uncultured Clostridium sp. TaxID=59620 RepID=UPI0026278043|nr:ATP--guanido phosphotransferase [uncultured Clostridium sp.]
MITLMNNKNVISSSITLFRNVKGYNFPIAMEEEIGRGLTEELVEKNLSINKNIEVIRFWKDEYNFENLKEQRIVRNKTLKNKNIVAVILDEKNNLSIIINEEEHLRLQITKGGYNIEEIYRYVREYDEKLENGIDYMFSETMGYLTSNIKHIGTGIKLEVMLHLPMLTLNEKINKLFSHKDKSIFTIEGKYGERGKAYGSIYLVKNITTTGISEEDLIDEFKTLLEYIIQEEEKERRRALKKYKNEIWDKIYRAYGILKEARILDSIEALDLLSYVRLGVELGIIDIDINTIEKAMLLSRNAYVRQHLDGETSIDKINRKRADIIRVVLK